MGKLALLKSLSENVLNSGNTIENNSGDTANIYYFIDENGNLTEIEKKSKNRLKYYIDEKLIIKEDSCVIGVSDPVEGDCSYGIGLGLGDQTWGYAKYD